MKNLMIILAVYFLWQPESLAQINRCSTTEHHENRMQEDQHYRLRTQSVEERVQALLTDRRANSAELGDVIEIPVVVHIIYRAPVHNISDQQIHSQMDVLNADFRRMNSDTSNTRGFFKSLAADPEIEFCLAQRDPLGNATTGITRTQTTVTDFSGNDHVKFDSLGGKTGWPSDNYLNIWVCNLGGSKLGYSSFPGEDPALDGIVIGYRYFGTIGTAQPPFNLGRTATHEIGHWLGLKHIWADTPDCTQDDNSNDTPKATGPNFGCPVDTPNTCFDPPSNPPDMFENFMDYTDDVCMNMFSAGQKAIMRATLATERISIVNSSSCYPVGISQDEPKLPAIYIQPNPVTDKLMVRLPEFDPGSTVLELYNVNGIRLFRNTYQDYSFKQIDLSVTWLPPGLYITRISQSGRSSSATFIKH